MGQRSAEKTSKDKLKREKFLKIAIQVVFIDFHSHFIINIGQAKWITRDGIFSRSTIFS